MEQPRRRALGKGLEELFSTEVLDFDSLEEKIVNETPKEEIVEIPLDELRSNPYQPRVVFDEQALNELAESIKVHGVFQPIIVKKSIKGYEIIAGERRVKASRMLGLTTIPAIVRDFNDTEMMEIALLENLQREDLSAVELAWAYKGIIDSLHITQDDLANRLGKSRSHVTNTLGLLRLRRDVQNMVIENKLSMGHARVLSKMDDSEKIEELAKRVVKENINVRELEELSNASDIRKKVPIKRVTNNNEYKYIEDKMKSVLGTRVKIYNKKMEIYFDSSDDLTRILDILNIKAD